MNFISFYIFVYFVHPDYMQLLYVTLFIWLIFQVSHERQELLSHPVTLGLINSKWQRFAVYIYYFKLLLYVLFLTFATGYVLTAAPVRYRDRHCIISTETNPANNDFTFFVFVYIGKYAVLALALLHLLLEVSLVFYFKRSLFPIFFCDFWKKTLYNKIYHCLELWFTYKCNFLKKQNKKTKRSVKVYLNLTFTSEQ